MSPNASSVSTEAKLHPGNAPHNNPGKKVVSILDLPSEMLVSIVEATDMSELANFRLVCQRFNDASTKPFASHFFSARSHVISAHSIAVLEAVSAHPVYGRYLKTVVLNSIRITKTWASSSSRLFVENLWSSTNLSEEEDSLAGESRFALSQDYRKALKRIFTHIKSHGNQVTLGVGDVSKTELPSHGSVRSHGWCKLVLESNGRYTWHNTETLSRMLAATKEAECDVEGLILAVDSRRREGTINQARFHNTIKGFLSEKLGSPLHINMTVNKTSWIVYDCNTGSLDFKGLSTVLGGANFPLQVLVEWLQTIEVKTLRLSRCSAFLGSFDLGMPLSSLESLWLEKFSLGPNTDWKSMMDLLATAPNLVRCHFSELSCIKIESSAVDPQAYVRNGWKDFMVHFRETDSNLIDLEGNDLSLRLQEIGDCLLAHEDAINQGTEYEFSGPAWLEPKK